MKLVNTVLNISSCGRSGNFFSMIYRILNQITQNPDTLNHFKEHKLLTINMLIIIKDQLIITVV